MFIKPLWDTKEYDVFVGKGWENWARVKMDRNKVTVVKSAIEIDPSTMRLIFFKIKKKFMAPKTEKENG